MIVESQPPDQAAAQVAPQQTQAEIEQVFKGTAPMPSTSGTQTQTQSSQGAAATALSPGATTAAAPVSMFGQTHIQNWQPGYVPPDVHVGQYTPNQDIYGKYQNLFGKPLESLGQAYGSLAGAETEFEKGAGTDRSFEGLGGKKHLEDLYNSGSPSAIAEAQGLATASYGDRPTGLSDQAMATILSQMSPLEGLDATQGSGLYRLLQGTERGATPGELEAEAARIRKDPAYMAAAQQFMADMGGLQSALSREQEEAATIAEARTNEEADIAKQTQDYFQGQVGEQEKAIQDAVDAKKARDKQVRDALAKFQESGDPKDLAGLPEGALNFDPTQFNTPTRDTAQRAQATYDKIMGQYADIKDIPLLELGLGPKQREIYRVPDSYGNTHPVSDAQFAQLMARQKALEDAGFGRHYSFGRYTGMADTPFGAYHPLYGGIDPFQDENPAAYVQGTPLGEFTADTVASAAQKARLNRAYEILGYANHLDESRAATPDTQILGDVAGFQKAEQEALINQLARVQGQDVKHAGEVRSARHAREKAERKRKAKRIGKIVGGISLAPLGGIGAPLGTYLGGKIGESTV